MPVTYPTAAFTIREIEYSIRIRDKDSTFVELRELLRSELNKFGPVSRNSGSMAENPIQEFLRTNIERSILIRENTRVYFLNYREKEGSLKIEFTLLILTSFVHYATIRHALDNLIKDTLAEYFEELLERHIPVNVTVQSQDKEIQTIEAQKEYRSERKKTTSQMLSRTIALSALGISIIFASIFFTRTFYSGSADENAKLREQYLDVLLEKKIIEAVKDQKFTINLYKIADTTNSSLPNQSDSSVSKK